MGRLEVFCGPMFSGKSEALIKRVQRSLIARRPTWVFKPEIDGRYAEAEVVSHAGQRVEAHNVASLSAIQAILDAEDADAARPGLIAIDEVQFFAPEGDAVDRSLAEAFFYRLVVASPHRIVVSGLDLDFRGVPFGIMPYLLALAGRVDKLCAVCAVCGEDASRSQRLVDGEPAPWDTPVVQIGGTEAYEPRCLAHWDAPQRR